MATGLLGLGKSHRTCSSITRVVETHLSAKMFELLSSPVSTEGSGLVRHRIMYELPHRLLLPPSRLGQPLSDLRRIRELAHFIVRDSSAGSTAFCIPFLLPMCWLGINGRHLTSLPRDRCFVSLYPPLLLYRLLSWIHLPPSSGGPVSFAYISDPMFCFCFGSLTASA